MTARLTQINRERASDQVLRALREGILSQTFTPGQRLNPDEIAARLGVSVTPVKEAITHLAAEGLIEVRPRSGTFVADLSAEDVAETFEIRAALESLAAERLVARLDAALLGRFRDLVEQMERPIASERDRLSHERLNLEFHGLIVERAGSRRLHQLYIALNAHIKIARVHYGRRTWAQRMDDERIEHRQILAALEARDGARLVAALRHHIGRASESLVADLADRSSRAEREGAR